MKFDAGQIKSESFTAFRTFRACENKISVYSQEVTFSFVDVDEEEIYRHSFWLSSG